MPRLLICIGTLSPLISGDWLFVANGMDVPGVTLGVSGKTYLMSKEAFIADLLLVTEVDVYQALELVYDLKLSFAEIKDWKHDMADDVLKSSSALLPKRRRKVPSYASSSSQDSHATA